ncbi:MAG: hypothetical protein CMO55_15795 [Verrucomicrobiales bacterium]|nr:hypothetical protein [Verrucomicrobiales bacterium]
MSQITVAIRKAKKRDRKNPLGSLSEEDSARRKRKFISRIVVRSVTLFAVNPEGGKPFPY